MEGLIYEAKELKNCLKAGFYERAYELAQNIEDELVMMAIKKDQSEATTSDQSIICST